MNIIIEVTGLSAGMVLEKPIINETGRIVLSEGTVLTDSMIARLKGQGIQSAFIRRAPSQVMVDFSRKYDQTLARVRDAFHTLRYFKEVPILEMREIISVSIDPLIDTVGVINHLYSMEQTDDATFQHSLHVAVLCGVLGRWLGYQGEVLKDLVLAGLLHDIGKTQVPLDIMNHPGELREAERQELEKHPNYGYQLLSSSPIVASAVLLGVLQHHEKMNGKGYPMQCHGDKIHSYARVIAVVDMYERITTAEKNGRRQTPFHAIPLIHDKMYDTLDPKIAYVFLQGLKEYFVGGKVLLSTGVKAEVINTGSAISLYPTAISEDGMIINLENKEAGEILAYYPG